MLLKCFVVVLWFSSCSCACAFVVVLPSLTFCLNLAVFLFLGMLLWQGGMTRLGGVQCGTRVLQPEVSAITPLCSLRLIFCFLLCAPFFLFLVVLSMQVLVFNLDPLLTSSNFTANVAAVSALLADIQSGKYGGAVPFLVTPFSTAGV